MDIIELAEYAMDQMPAGPQLGEFKYLNTTRESIATRNDSVNTMKKTHNSGFGIRILFEGNWGYSASNELTKFAVDQNISNAFRIANSAKQRSPKVVLTNEPVVEDKVSTKYELNPFEIELEDKLDTLLSTAIIAKEYPEIKFINGHYTAQRDDLLLYNNEGTKIQQTIIWNGAYMVSIASGNGDTQVRKYPDDYYATAGWEYIKDLDIPGNIEEKIKEQIKLLEAPSMKSGRSTILLDPAQLGIQLHESCGHPSELDRSLGFEAAYAGTSFLRKELLKEDFMYGNELVNINADATIPKGLGSFPYDHEGVKGKNTPLVKNGKFVGFLTSRETAPIIGLDSSGGTMRSELYDKSPIIRM
ncbi:MAG: TldD/PmbA family protein, partial [Candidatus Kariarchaeaceae archaeon]